MSDDQQPEEFRPIPDGGLKDAMPGWLKRPPAWRNMPTAEQRHERTLPEPDTSEIDPRTLVDVSDLPQWLQTIAARGEVSVPEPDETVEHAVELVQAASRRDEPDPGPTTFVARSSDAAGQSLRDGASPDNASGQVAESGEDAAPEPDAEQEVGLLTDEPATSLPPAPGAHRPTYMVWTLVACGIIMAVLVVVILYLL